MAEQADKLMAWGMIFRLDGDLCRCKGCGRGIHICNRDQEFLHSSDCDFRSEEFPWKELDEALDSPILQSVRRLVGECKGKRDRFRERHVAYQNPQDGHFAEAYADVCNELSALIDGKDGEG